MITKRLRENIHRRKRISQPQQIGEERTVQEENTERKLVEETENKIKE